MGVEPIIYCHINKPVFILNDGSTIPVDRQIENIKFTAPSQYREHFYDSFLKIIESNKLTPPFILHIDGFGIPQLKTLKLNCNVQGLKFFLNENLIKYQGAPVEINRNNATDFTNECFTKFRFDSDAEQIGCVQFDQIQTFVENNKLEDVTVYTIEKDYSNLLTNYNFRIEYYDSFIVSELETITEYFSSKKEIEYKFLNTNYRYNSHRYIVASFLSNYNSKMSWAFQGDVEKLNSNCVFDIHDLEHYTLISQGIDNLNRMVPICIDIEFDKTSICGDLTDLLLLPGKAVPLNHDPVIYRNVFCSIVNENEFFDITASISEKTLYAIQNKTPFVLVSTPNSLRLLQELGFKTFSRWWSEEYDNIQNSKSRMDNILNTIQFIDTLDPAETLDEMKHILDYNFKHLQQLKEQLLDDSH